MVNLLVSPKNDFDWLTKFPRLIEASILSVTHFVSTIQNAHPSCGHLGYAKSLHGGLSF